MRKKCVRYKKYLNCKFCFSFLRNKKLAEMHLINYHPRGYDMICKNNGVGDTKKVLIGNSPDDCPAGFCEVTLYEPEVKVERLPFKRCGSISTENTYVKLGDRTERKSKTRAQSIIQNVISTTGSDPDHLSESFLSHSELKPEPLLKSNRKKGSWKPSAEPYVNRYKYSCDKCPAKSYSIEEFEGHISIHNNPTRKLITCLICQRVFNKRDSLNSHIAAHETAEAKEENLNLLESWPELPQNSNYSRTRFACKHCLLMCTNHVSFLQHINSEHGGTAKQYSCSFRKCSKTFVKIRELVKHAKSSHPKDFYGRLTWRRMNKGVYNGTKAVRKANRRKKNDGDSDSTMDDSDDEETLESEEDTETVLNKRALRSTGPLNVKVESDKRAVGGSCLLNIKVESIDISESIPSPFQPPSSSVIVVSNDIQTQVKHEIPRVVVVSQNDEIDITKDDFINFRSEATLPDVGGTDSIIVKQESK